jgi:membrane-bound lytic murein transglycosylase B
MEKHMTAVTPETMSEQAAEPRHPSTFARRLAALLARIRTGGEEDLRTTVARAIDEAFAGFHREMRS